MIMKAQITERGILFSSEMVRAILDDSKTETRRVITVNNGQIVLDYLKFGNHMEYNDYIACPYGKPGDILYVRETFFVDVVSSPGFPLGSVSDVYYRADCDEIKCRAYKWKPSIHMPKKFSRIKLKIKEIRVERVQGISNNDILAEGISRNYYDCPHGTPGKHDYCVLYKGCFRKTWDSLNKKRGFGWDVNPYCWVIKFERIK